MKLVANIELFKSPFTVIYISADSIIIPDQQINKLLGFKEEPHREEDFEDRDEAIPLNKRLKFVASALFLRPLLLELKNSRTYRNNVLENISHKSGNLNNNTLVLRINLISPEQELIDYSWNERMLRLLWMKLEIENAFSWLSTLGGAYSALGDYFEYCADEAARISKQQYKLSKLLGDDSLAERSKLYLAIAYAQKGDLKKSRHIIRNVCEYSLRNKDKRLNRMCKGVWAKLRYLRKLKSENNNKKTNGVNGKIVPEVKNK